MLNVIVLIGSYIIWRACNETRIQSQICELEDRLRILDAACKLTDEEWEERMSDA